MNKTIRYYVAIGATILIAVFAGLLYMNRSHEIERLVHLTEDQNILIAKAIQIDLLEDHPLITDQVSAKFNRLASSLKHKTKLRRVDIIQPAGHIVLSSDPSVVGAEVENREGFEKARHKTAYSWLQKEQTKSPSAYSKINRTFVNSYVRLDNQQQKQQTVFYISMDVTDQAAAGELSNTKLAGLAILIMGAMLLGLQYFLRKEEELMQAREKDIEGRTKELKVIEQNLKKEAAIRRNAEQAFRESESRLRAVLNNATSLIALKDMNGRFLMVNRRFEQIFDVSSQDIIGRNSYDLFDEEMAEKVHAADLDVIDRHEPTEIEEELQTAAGIKTFVTVRFPLFNPDHSVYAIGTISVDISERKKAEKALIESEQSLSNAQRIARLGNWHWNLKDDKVVWSTETYRLLGYEPGNVTPSRELYEQSIHPDDLTRVQHANQQSLQFEKPYKVDHRIVWPDGAVRYVTALGEVATDNQNNVIGLDVTLHDVTELKEAEEALRQSEERYRNFAADAAHELRTPLAILKLRLSDLNDQRAAAALLEDVDGMHRLLEQLLALTRLDTLVINPDDLVDLGHLARDMAAFMAPIALKDGKMLEVTGYSKPVFIKGSEETLRQAFRNLVENALRYTPKGKRVTIDISSDATVKIIDQGKGIAEDQLQNIFKRFLRADQNPGGGAGLGLSIVKRTVEAHGGTVQAENGKKAGAIFTLTFPLVEEDRPPLANVTSA